MARREDGGGALPRNPSLLASALSAARPGASTGGAASVATDDVAANAAGGAGDSMMRTRARALLSLLQAVGSRDAHRTAGAPPDRQTEYLEPRRGCQGGERIASDLGARYSTGRLGWACWNRSLCGGREVSARGAAGWPPAQTRRASRGTPQRAFGAPRRGARARSARG